MASTGADGITIPDHEVITRRKQFRMKKDRAERKKEKKQQKQLEKEEKRVAREKKKAEKEKIKLAAKTKKGDKETQPKKRGRKANEKAEGWKRDTPGTEVAAKRTVRSHRMKRLKKMALNRQLNFINDEVREMKEERKKTKAKGQEKGKASPAETLDLKPGETKNEGEEPVKDEGMKVSSDKACKKGKKTAAKSKAKKGGASSPKKASKTQSKKTQSKTQSKTKKTVTKEKGNANKKRTAKNATGEDDSKPKRSRGPRKPQGDPDPSVVDEVSRCLVECGTSKCTHPSMDKVNHGVVHVQPYKTRMCCGITMERRFFTNKKAQGKGKAHVTYFSCKTACLYSNVVLAELWVSRLQTCGLGIRL